MSQAKVTGNRLNAGMTKAEKETVKVLETKSTVWLTLRKHMTAKNFDQRESRVIEHVLAKRERA